MLFKETSKQPKQSRDWTLVLQALEFLSKAHRCDVRAGGWETDPQLFKEVIERAVHMGEGERALLSHTHTHTLTTVVTCGAD